MFKKILIVAVVSSVIVACSSTKTPEVPVNSSIPLESTPAIDLAPVVSSAPVASSIPTAINHNSVYFAFNQYDIKDVYSGIIKANSNYLATSNSAKVQVQGNTDDIGSVEYNLALGQKRADAVKRALIVGGANPAQIEATSNGKLKPKYSNDTDATRAQNRRVDVIYEALQPSGYSVDSNELPMVDQTVYDGTVVEGVQ